MKDSPGLHLKTYIFIFFMVLFAPLGNVLLSKGMKGVGSAKNWPPGEILHVLGSIITSGYIGLGSPACSPFLWPTCLFSPGRTTATSNRLLRFRTRSSRCWVIFFSEKPFPRCAGWAYL